MKVNICSRELACYMDKVVNPFQLPRKQPNDEILSLLEKWITAGASSPVGTKHVRLEFIGPSYIRSINVSARESVWSTIKDFLIPLGSQTFWDWVGNPVSKTIKASVGQKAWNSAHEAFMESTWNAIGAYIGSLFPQIEKWKYIDHEKGTYPFQSVVDLWCMGIVPSYNGKLWRLHNGIDADVIWTSDS